MKTAGLIYAAAAAVLILAGGSPAWGQAVNFAAGKFYLFGQAPYKNFTDEYPLAPWSSGTKLTDECSAGAPGRRGVAWRGSSATVVLDLGQVRPIDRFRVHVLANEDSDIVYPESVQVFAGVGDTFEEAGTIPSFRSPRASCWGELSLEVPLSCRYVRFVFKSASKKKLLMTDEIEVWGNYSEDRKYVPAYGAYHGAFNNSTSFADNTDPSVVVDPAHKSCPISTFEALVGKKISMFLWYQGMKPGRSFEEVQKIRDNHAGVDFNGNCRFMIYGWLPAITSAEQAAGDLDEYHKQYFAELAADENKFNGPVWIRPANEMNGSWVAWYGDPENYVKAWRRMYNIAEQLGATKYNVFVWSPNSYDCPVKEGNRMKDYYPGDIYVDWLGASVYPPSIGKYPEDERYPAHLLKEVESISPTKPVMITEGGFSSDYGQKGESNMKSASKYVSDHLRWVKEWFELSKTHPRVKAVIWENHINNGCGDRRIHKDAEALKLYREMVQDPYWLDRIPEEVGEEINARMR